MNRLLNQSLLFQTPQYEDFMNLKPYLSAPGEFTQEFSFVNMMMWKREYQDMFSLQDGQLIIKMIDHGVTIFSLPLGGDLKTGIEKICNYAAENGVTPQIWAADGPRLREFRALFADWRETEHRDGFEYIYRRQDLVDLAGKKYHAKRNHIAAFSKQFDWSYEEIDDENLEEVLAMARAWYLERAAEMDETMETECKAVREVLLRRRELDVRGGLIRVEGKVVAFTFGSPINGNVFDVHVEKALGEYAGAYPVINQAFASRLSPFEFLNREDDLGLEGLRRAKLSYRPAILLGKYSFVPKEERL